MAWAHQWFSCQVSAADADVAAGTPDVDPGRRYRTAGCLWAARISSGICL